MTKTKNEPEITKRRVTMTNVLISEESGKIVTRRVQAVDYVRPDFLNAYVTDAKTRWELVQVFDEPDAGPGGYHGSTTIPFGTPVYQTDERGVPTGVVEFHEFPHPDAGTFYPATDCKNCDHAPSHPLTGEKARIVREDSK